jgi:hypothetical protein
VYLSRSHEPSGVIVFRQIVPKGWLSRVFDSKPVTTLSSRADLRYELTEVSQTYYGSRWVELRRLPALAK